MLLIIIKGAMRYHCRYHTCQAIIKKIKKRNAGKDMEKLEPLYTLDGNVK